MIFQNNAPGRFSKCSMSCLQRINRNPMKNKNNTHTKKKLHSEVKGKSICHFWSKFLVTGTLYTVYKQLQWHNCWFKQKFIRDKDTVNYCVFINKLLERKDKISCWVPSVRRGQPACAVVLPHPEHGHHPRRIWQTWPRSHRQHSHACNRNTPQYRLLLVLMLTFSS